MCDFDLFSFLVVAVCKIPARLDNGVVLTDKYDNEGILEFTCNHGYKLMGSRVLRCVSGHWSNNIPTCRKGNGLDVMIML